MTASVPMTRMLPIRIGSSCSLLPNICSDSTALLQCTAWQSHERLRILCSTAASVESRWRHTQGPNCCQPALEVQARLEGLSHVVAVKHDAPADVKDTCESVRPGLHSSLLYNANDEEARLNALPHWDKMPAVSNT
jgi:hypothetical protein